MVVKLDTTPVIAQSHVNTDFLEINANSTVGIVLTVRLVTMLTVHVKMDALKDSKAIDAINHAVLRSTDETVSSIAVITVLKMKSVTQCLEIVANVLMVSKMKSVMKNATMELMEKIVKINAGLALILHHVIILMVVVLVGARQDGRQQRNVNYRVKMVHLE